MAHVKSNGGPLTPTSFCTDLQLFLCSNRVMLGGRSAAPTPLSRVDSNALQPACRLLHLCPRHCLPQQHQDHLKNVQQHILVLLSLCNPYLALQRSRCDAPYSPRPAAQHAAPPRQPSRLSHAPSLSPPLPFAFSLAATGDLFQHFFIGTQAHVIGAA